MLIVYLTVPIMILAIAVAVVPLLWTMTHEPRLTAATTPQPNGLVAGAAGPLLLRGAK